MDYEVLMPQFSDTMERGKVIRWLKKEGDYVEKGEPIAEIEAEKAVMELQAFRSGVLKKILAEEGQEVEVGKVIALIEVGAPKGEIPTPPVEAPKPVEKKPERREEPPKVEVKKEKMELPPGMASPYAKVLAKELGIDIQELQKEERLPSPAHEKDIRELILHRFFTPKALELLKDYDVDPQEVLSHFGQTKMNEDMLLTYIENMEVPKKVPLSSTQKSLISNLTKSIQNPQYRITDRLDLSLIPKLEGITLTHWLIRVIGDSMMYFDRLRAYIKEDNYLILPNAHIGIAVGVGEELYNVVIKRVNRKSLREISQESTELRRKAEEGRLSQEDIRGATLTVSNLGMFGILSFDAILPYGQACIVAVGALTEDNKVYATFTFDHRIVNGLTGALFVKHVKERLLDKNYIKSLLRGV